jgi:hypothetical protein
MPKFFSVLFVVLFSFIAFAQDFSSSSNQATESYGQVPIPEQDALSVTITHSVDPVNVVAGSVACNAGGLHTDNSYYRAFTLSAFGINNPFNVISVQIGIEQATSTSGSQSITCNLYTGVPGFPTGYPGSFTLIGTSTVTITPQNLTLYTFNVAGTVPVGQQLVVEIFTPNGQTLGNGFFIGSNSAGQTAPSYIAAVDCGISSPTDLAALGFPNMHIIMSVTGDEVVPVELTSFTATANENEVVLNWSTATETNNQGFEVQKSFNGEFETIAFVNGHGTTTESQTYLFSDKNVNVGSYSYRLKQVDFDGSFEYSDVVEIDVLAPAVFALDQNYPNPFNPSTKITFQLAVESKVSLKVFNVLGQEVANLLNSNVLAGSHNVNFDASSLNSGVYLYRIEATGIDGSNFIDVKKMILTK